MNLLFVTGPRSARAADRLTVLGLQGLRFRQRLDVRRGEPEDANRAGDILDGLLAQIGKGERELVSDLIIRRTRDAQAPPARREFPGGRRC